MRNAGGMTEDDETVETGRKRCPVVCPLCRTHGDSAECENGTSDWMVCTRCGHPWAYAEN